MATTILETLGTVGPDGTLELDQKLAVPPGRVRVRVESVEAPVQPKESLVEFVQRNRRELEAADHKFRTKEKIDAELEAMRGEWDDRLDELDRLRSNSKGKE